MPPRPPLNQLGQLTDAFLGRVTFERDYDFDIDETSNFTYTLDVETEAERAEGDHWAASLTGVISWQHKEGREVAPPFALEVTVVGIFEWVGEAEYDDDEIVDWLTYNGELLLWPYLRAYMQMITGASDAPPLTIYTIGVPRRPPSGDGETTPHEAQHH